MIYTTGEIKEGSICFIKINLPSQQKHGARLIGRWMVPLNETVSEIFAIWEYDSYNQYKEIEAMVRSDVPHVNRINSWYDKHGGREYIFKTHILEMKNESLYSTLTDHAVTNHDIQFWLEKGE